MAKSANESLELTSPGVFVVVRDIYLCMYTVYIYIAFYIYSIIIIIIIITSLLYMIIHTCVYNRLYIYTHVTAISHIHRRI